MIWFGRDKGWEEGEVEFTVEMDGTESAVG